MIYNFNYIIALLIFCLSLFSLIINQNLIKKLFSLGIMQTSVLLFYISLSKVDGGKIPVLRCLDYQKCPEIYTNPIPHVLMLTAIVVGVAILALGLSLIMRIKSNIGTIEENEILKTLNTKDL